MNTIEINSDKLRIIAEVLLKVAEGQYDEFKRQVQDSALKYNAEVNSSWFSRVFKSKKPEYVQGYWIDDEEFWKNLRFKNRINKLNELITMCRLSPNSKVQIDPKTANFLTEERDQLKISQDAIIDLAEEVSI